MTVPSSAPAFTSEPCTCPQDMGLAIYCGQCRNGGRPLPPYRVSKVTDEGPAEDDGTAWYVTITKLTTDGQSGTSTVPFPCACGADVDTGDEVWRASVESDWRGTKCCGGPAPRTATDTEEN